MQTISFVDQMDENLVAYWGAYAFAEGGRLQEVGNTWVIQTAIRHIMFNSVIVLRHQPAEIEVALELAGTSARESGVPLIWRVGPEAESAALRAQLVKAGLQPVDPFPAMRADLSDVPDLPQIEGLVIETASGPEERRAWGGVAAAAFEMDVGVGAELGLCEATLPDGMVRDQLRFTGFIDGVPVAASALVMNAELAGIYAVGTLPQARQRGVGRAMTLHAMAEGRRRGAATAILQASPMGRPLYEQIGFRKVFDYQAYVQV